MKRESAATVQQYLAEIESDHAREALEALRKIILDVVPEAVECMSYGIPTYKFNKSMGSIAAFKNHCSFFPGRTVDLFMDQLGSFKTSKGTIQFKPESPIPEDLVRAILKERFWPTK